MILKQLFAMTRQRVYDPFKFDLGEEVIYKGDLLGRVVGRENESCPVYEVETPCGLEQFFEYELKDVPHGNT